MEAQTPCSWNILGNFRHHTAKKHKCADWLHQGVINGPCPSWCHEGLHQAHDIAAHCWACSSEPSHSEQKIPRCSAWAPFSSLHWAAGRRKHWWNWAVLVGPGGLQRPVATGTGWQHPLPSTCFSLLSYLSRRYLNSFKGIFLWRRLIWPNSNLTCANKNLK